MPMPFRCLGRQGRRARSRRGASARGLPVPSSAALRAALEWGGVGGGRWRPKLWIQKLYGSSDEELGKGRRTRQRRLPG